MIVSIIEHQAGPIALAHNMCEEAKIVPSVAMEVVSGKVVTNGVRPASGVKRPIPAVATTINGSFAVPPIIRGHTLRTFVEINTPEQRYADVASGLQLGPLVEVQKNLRSLRTQIKTAAEDGMALRRVDMQLEKESAQSVKTWSAAAVVAYANELVLAPLDSALALTSLGLTDPSYVEVEARAGAEENKIGIAGLRQIRNAAASIWAEVIEPDSGERVTGGSVVAFETAVMWLDEAEEDEKNERNKAAATVFQDL